MTGIYLPYSEALIDKGLFYHLGKVAPDMLGNGLPKVLCLVIVLEHKSEVTMVPEKLFGGALHRLELCHLYCKCFYHCSHAPVSITNIYSDCSYFSFRTQQVIEQVRITPRPWCYAESVALPLPKRRDFTLYAGRPVHGRTGPPGRSFRCPSTAGFTQDLRIGGSP